MTPKRFPSAVFLISICLFNGLACLSLANTLEEAHVCVGERGEEQVCQGDIIAEKEESVENVTQGYPDGMEDDDEGVVDDGKETNICKDEHESCEFWATGGECENNPGFMLVSCRSSCNVCDRITTIAGSEMFGEKQEVERDDPHRGEVLQIIAETKEYMAKITSDPKYETVREECLNRHSQCALWVTHGECKANPSYMTLNCAPSCKSCEKIDIRTRCPKNDTLVDAFGPGDLNRMFERIAQDESLDVTVLSRPSEKTEEESDDHHPWVITIDDFVSQTECDRLKILGAEEGYKRSTDVGKKKFDGTFESKESSGRTSYNAWCSNECYNDAVTVNVMGRIANTTGIPVENSEHLQLLRYQVGQFYNTHHDYIHSHRERNPGPRVLTAYLYLNDVEAGGGTNFPKLDVTVMPRRGRLLLWPSVLDEDPNMKDYSTDHQALPVEAGEKYGANGWLHLRDFVESLGKGCI